MKRVSPLCAVVFKRFFQESDGMTERRCGKDSVVMVHSIMTSIISDMPETMCQRYDVESEECQGLLLPAGTPSKGGDNRPQLAKLLDTVFGSR